MDATTPRQRRSLSGEKEPQNEAAENERLLGPPETEMANHTFGSAPRLNGSPALNHGMGEGLSPSPVAADQESDYGEDANEDESDEEKEEDLAPDGGWGWVVCMGSFLINFILDGTLFSFGVLMLDLVTDLGETKSTTSSIGSAQMGIHMIMGPIISVLLQKYTIRQVVIVGSLVSSSAFVVSVFAPNVYVLIFTYGVIGGIGFGMVFLPALIVLVPYFSKKRAIATGIATSGSGLGTFAYAWIMDVLLENFNWRGTVLILGGLILHCLLFGMLFRPLVPKAGKGGKSAIRKKSQERKTSGNIGELESLKGTEDMNGHSRKASLNVKETPSQNGGHGISPEKYSSPEGLQPQNILKVNKRDSQSLEHQYQNGGMICDSTSSTVIEGNDLAPSSCSGEERLSGANKCGADEVLESPQTVPCGKVIEIPVILQTPPSPAHVLPNSNTSGQEIHNGRGGCELSTHSEHQNTLLNSPSDAVPLPSSANDVPRHDKANCDIPQSAIIPTSTIDSLSDNMQISAAREQTLINDANPKCNNLNHDDEHICKSDNNSITNNNSNNNSNITSNKNSGIKSSSSHNINSPSVNNNKILANGSVKSHSAQNISDSSLSANSNNNNSQGSAKSNSIHNINSNQETNTSHNTENLKTSTSNGVPNGHLHLKPDDAASPLEHFWRHQNERNSGKFSVSRIYRSADHIHNINEGLANDHDSSNNNNHHHQGQTNGHHYSNKHLHPHGKNNHYHHHLVPSPLATNDKLVDLAKSQTVSLYGINGYRGHHPHHHHHHHQHPHHRFYHLGGSRVEIMEPLKPSESGSHLGGSTQHLAAYHYFGSMASFGAAMTHASSTEKVDVITSDAQHKGRDSCCLLINRFFPLKLLADPVFLLLLVGFVMWTAQTITITYLPNYAVSLGIERSKAAFLISIIGIANVLGRLVAGFITDCLSIPSIWLYIGALVIAAGVNIVIPLCTSYHLLAACSAVFGLCMAVAVSMRTIVLVDQMGLAALTQSFGIVALFQGIAFIINPPIAGSMIDAFESSKPSFWLTAGMYTISASVTLWAALLIRRRRARGGQTEPELTVQEPADV